MELRIRFEHWLLRKILRGTAGIVLYPYVLFKRTPEMVDDRLLRHEMQHVIQVRKYGWWKFYSRWLWWTIKHGYRDNPLEIEARWADDLPMPPDLQSDIDDATLEHRLKQHLKRSGR